MIRKKIISRLIVLVALLAALSGCGSSDAKYEKDLSSVFNIPLDASVEDIIEFEADTYGNTEYDLRTGVVYDRPMLFFAPYVGRDDKTHYRHRYLFNPNTERLLEIDYRSITNISSVFYQDTSNTCVHVEALKKRVLDISSDWDKKDDKCGWLMMFGNIDDVRCKITYCENDESIWLSVEE